MAESPRSMVDRALAEVERFLVDRGAGRLKVGPLNGDFEAFELLRLVVRARELNGG